MVTLSPSKFQSSRVNCSSFLLARDHSHTTSDEKNRNFTRFTLVRKKTIYFNQKYKINLNLAEPLSPPPDDIICELLYIFADKVNWDFLWVMFSFCGTP